jgi:2,3-dihydroxyphenylpropionate 1,2-dioxygenase
MTVALICASHSPLMYCFARAPASHAEIERIFEERAAAVRAYDPELVFVFGPDHFNGFFLQLMPSFCVGTRCRAVADIGGFPGRLHVPGEEALACVVAVRNAGVDVAVSYDMTVDHGFSQTMHRVLGAVDARPTIPIFINSIAEPYVPFRRSRMLGEAVGAYAATLNRRVLFIASGGMSHNPTRYYPKFGTGEPAVTEYQLRGGTAADMSESQWLQRLDVMHREGAGMLATGKRTRADLKLNPAIDQRFLEILASGDLERVDEWDPARLVEEAGIGSLELHTWLAAAAANRAAGGARAQVDLYAETLEFGIAFGMAHAGADR